MSEWIKCDQCPAQAKWLAKGLSGDLYFCGHHYNNNSGALAKWAYEMIELNKVEETPILEEKAEI